MTKILTDNIAYAKTVRLMGMLTKYCPLCFKLIYTSRFPHKRVIN